MVNVQTLMNNVNNCFHIVYEKRFIVLFALCPILSKLHFYSVKSHYSPEKCDDKIMRLPEYELLEDGIKNNRQYSIYCYILS